MAAYAINLRSGNEIARRGVYDIRDLLSLSLARVRVRYCERDLKLIPLALCFLVPSIFVALIEEANCGVYTQERDVSRSSLEEEQRCVQTVHLSGRKMADTD